MTAGAAAALRQLRAARRLGILDLAVVVCLADVVNGVVAPTFTLYARGLGASLTLVGALTAVVGLTKLLTALPTGVLADRAGRRGVIAGGVLLMGLACGLFTVGGPRLLLASRVLYGLGMVATFSIGVAYIADRTAGRSRDLAIGAYVSAQGTGFAGGPMLAGALAGSLSTASIYRLLAALGLVTAAYAWLRLDRRKPVSVAHADGHGRGIDLLRRSTLAGASLSNLVMLLMFSGSVVPFLALTSQHLGLDPRGVALVYAVRATTSTITRLPAGALARRFSNAHLVLLALAADATAAVGVGLASDVTLLVAAVVVDGIAFGTFLAASQSLVAETVPARRVGSAMGVYSMAGSIGETFGGLAMGGVAAALGAAAVFRLDAVVLLGGLAGTWALLRSSFVPRDRRVVTAETSGPAVDARALEE